MKNKAVGLKRIFTAFELSSAGDVDNRSAYWQSALKETVKRKSIHLKLQEHDVQKIRAISYE